MVDKIIKNIEDKLVCCMQDNRITKDDVISIKDQITDIQKYYEELLKNSTLKIMDIKSRHVGEMYALIRNHEEEYDELIEANKKDIQYAIDRRTKNDLICKDKLLCSATHSN